MTDGPAPGRRPNPGAAAGESFIAVTPAVGEGREAGKRGGKALVYQPTRAEARSVGTIHDATHFLGVPPPLDLPLDPIESPDAPP